MIEAILIALAIAGFGLAMICGCVWLLCNWLQKKVRGDIDPYWIERQPKL